MPSAADTPSPPSVDAISGIQSYVARTLQRVQDRLEAQTASDLPPVQRLVRHVERYRGKMVRPTLAAIWGLAARPDAPSLNLERHDAPENLVIVAAVCEMVHLATLVHDDVLDEADTRRRTATVNRLHGNETAVILGDYLLSSAYHLCCQTGSTAAALAIGEVGMTLCAGELLQLHHREDFSLDEPTYFEIIDRKTASLIAVACRLGAAAAGCDDPAMAARADAFGRTLGVAFQIQDDLLDLTGAEATVGKSVGKDVEKGKLTLPLIHHLAAAPAARRGETLALLADTALPAIQRTAQLREAMSLTGSIDHARSVAVGLVSRARDQLTDLPDSPARSTLALMADAVVTRSF